MIQYYSVCKTFKSLSIKSLIANSNKIKLPLGLEELLASEEGQVSFESRFTITNTEREGI